MKQSVKVFHGLTISLALVVEGIDVVDALVLEAVEAVDASTLVVAAENEELLEVLDLVHEGQGDSLERLFAAVYAVAKEEVGGLRWKSAVFEQQKIVVGRVTT